MVPGRTDREVLNRRWNGGTDVDVGVVWPAGARGSAVNNAPRKGGSLEGAKTVGSGQDDGAQVGLPGFGGHTPVDFGVKRVGHATADAQPICAFVGGIEPGVLGGFNRVSIGTGVIGIVTSILRLVTDGGVPDTEFCVNDIAYRHA